MSRDGVVVVTHDTSLKRCTGKNARVYDLTFAEIEALDAGRWFSARFARTRIPSFEEVLQLCQGRIDLNVEIKPSAATPTLEAETVRLLRAYGFEGTASSPRRAMRRCTKSRSWPRISPPATFWRWASATTTTCRMPTFSAWSIRSSPPAWSTRSTCAARPSRLDHRPGGRCPPHDGAGRRRPHHRQARPGA